MCRVFEVSESGYYAWRRKPESATMQENQAIYEALKTSYDLNKGRAGLDKMLEDVQIQFPTCSRNRLYKIQKQHKLYSIRKRKFKATTNSKHDYPVAQNLLNQNFHVDEPNKVWVTDISYIGTDEGWLYLATVKDLFDRQIVGFATGRPDQHRTLQAGSMLGYSPIQAGFWAYPSFGSWCPIRQQKLPESLKAKPYDMQHEPFRGALRQRLRGDVFQHNKT